MTWTLARWKSKLQKLLGQHESHMSQTTNRIGRSSSSASLLIILFHCIKGIPACRVGLDFRLHGSHRFFKSHAPVEGNVWPLFHCSFNVTKCNLGKVKLEPIMLVSSFSNFAWGGPYEPYDGPRAGTPHDLYTQLLDWSSLKVSFPIYSFLFLVCRFSAVFLPALLHI